MKLYYAPGTCALAPHIALEWAGQPYEAELVQLGSEEFLKINPLGMVPALKDGDQPIMTQADAILKYIETKRLSTEWHVADDPVSQFELNEALAFLTGDVHPAFWPFFGPDRYTVNTDEVALNDVREASFARIERVMNHLEARLKDSAHVVQGKRTIADPYAFAMTRWTVNTPKPWQEYPGIKRFMETMLQDSGVQAAMKAQGLA